MGTIMFVLAGSFFIWMARYAIKAGEIVPRRGSPLIASEKPIPFWIVTRGWMLAGMLLIYEGLFLFFK